MSLFSHLQIRCGSQLSLIDQPSRSVALWHIELNQPNLIRLVELWFLEQLVQLCGSMNFI